MLIPIKSWSSWKLSHVGSKARSLGQVSEGPSVHSGGHSLDPKLMKLCQNVTVKSRLSSKLGHVGSKTRSQGQIIKKTCLHSRGHSSDPKFMKLCQNFNPYNI